MVFRVKILLVCKLGLGHIRKSPSALRAGGGLRCSGGLHLAEVIVRFFCL